MKSRAILAKEYNTKYNHIPRDYNERLYWLYDYLKLDDIKSNEILHTRDSMMNSLYYNTFHIVLYEEPDGAKRPRFRFLRKDLSKAAINDPTFIHVYSPNAKSDSNHMQRLMNDNDFSVYNNLLSTPCHIIINTFHKIPSNYNKEQIILSEIGLIRPIIYPDWDNIGKKYSDMNNDNVWLDDNLVIDGEVHKYYSVLPRVEITINYLNMVYNKHQYLSVTNRKNYNQESNITYYKGDNN